jgi:hypothetical protein
MIKRIVTENFSDETNGLTGATNNIEAEALLKGDTEHIAIEVFQSVQDEIISEMGNRDVNDSGFDFIMTGEDLLNMNITELPYLVKPLLPKTGVVAIAGSSDVGKSSFLRQLAISIIKGEASFFAFEINAAYKNVIYVCTEDD